MKIRAVKYNSAHEILETREVERDMSIYGATKVITQMVESIDDGAVDENGEKEPLTIEITITRS
jgi:hypothetical protein